MLPLSRAHLSVGGWDNPSSHRSFPALFSYDAKDHILLSKVLGPQTSARQREKMVPYSIASPFYGPIIQVA